MKIFTGNVNIFVYRIKHRAYVDKFSLLNRTISDWNNLQ